MKLISRLLNKILNKNYKRSYSQCGEDLIVKYIFDSVGVKMPTYIDIGAHDPEFISNTALFYRLGSWGINVEPYPVLFKKFLQKRKKDVNLDIGISDSVGELDFYIMSAQTLNTFSKVEAEKMVSEYGFRIESIRKVKVDTIQNIIWRFCKGAFPDFLSLDVEGLDFRILNSIKYEESSPTVICVETISYSETGKGIKDTSIIELLESKGYMGYADTYINTIFVKRNKWVRS